MYLTLSLKNKQLFPSIVSSLPLSPFLSNLDDLEETLFHFICTLYALLTQLCFHSYAYRCGN